MTTEPDQLKARIEALLDELPGNQDGTLSGQADIAELARRLEQAHNMLVRALESVERG